VHQLDNKVFVIIDARCKHEDFLEAMHLNTWHFSTVGEIYIKIFFL